MDSTNQSESPNLYFLLCLVYPCSPAPSPFDIYRISSKNKPPFMKNEPNFKKVKSPYPAFSQRLTIYRLSVIREKRTRFKAILKPKQTPTELRQTCSKADSNPIEPDFRTHRHTGKSDYLRKNPWQPEKNLQTSGESGVRNPVVKSLKSKGHSEKIIPIFVKGT